MTLSLNIPDSEPKSFALQVVRRLRDAGFEAVWAGGCVRDALLKIVPGDYDVATSARPDDVVRLFGRKRSVSVGASFGVIIVLGERRSEGQVEVAAFRSDGPYSDGRRPDSVEYCSAEEDALRRDFTINGMFFDPISGQVIDYVNGQQDLEQGVIRAIGNAEERFAEDKLRMLRAARFAARYSFSLDTATADAVRRQAAELNQVSVERIAQELRRMLGHPSRLTAMELLVDMRLFSVVFPMVPDSAMQSALRAFPFLKESAFEPAMALLFQHLLNPATDQPRKRTQAISEAGRSFRLSNEEISALCWLCDAFERSRSPDSLPLHELKPLLADKRRDLLLDLIQATVQAGTRPAGDIEYLQRWLAETPPESLDPPPLITGAELTAMGLKPGPEFSRILRLIREEQLDELISTPEEALQRAQQLS